MPTPAILVPNNNYRPPPPAVDTPPPPPPPPPPNNNNTKTAGNASLAQWDDMALMLPTQQRVRDIVLKMQTMSLVGLLPPKLDYMPTASDKALQDNILLLFSAHDSDTVSTKIDIVTNALLAVVARTNEFMTEAQRNKIDAASNNLTNEQRKNLVSFYPCLMALVKALLIHCQNLAVDMEGTQKSATVSVTKCVLEVWQQLMGELHDLHSVILFASKKSLIDLGDFPQKWLNTIQNMNIEINRLRTIILNCNDDLNLQQAHLNERNKEIQLIMSKYGEVETNLQLIKAERNNACASLESFIYIPNIAHENVLRIQNIFPNYHASS